MNDLPLNPSPTSILGHIRRIGELAAENRKLAEQKYETVEGKFFQQPCNADHGDEA